jgi:DNA-directed RNA polymerase specialized sigma24 family protein
MRLLLADQPSRRTAADLSGSGTITASARPRRSADGPDDLARNPGALAQLAAALAGLPARQRVAVTLRDVAGHSSAEVCDMFSISAANQRAPAAPRGRAA